MTISPYELLRASKPLPRPSVVTPYDLYSRIQQEPAAPFPSETAFPMEAALLPEAARQAEPAPPASTALPAAARKTHYISDIHSRHSAAGRHARFTKEPLF